MIRLAFKIAAATGDRWSMLIAKESGSPYSHVEVWLDGPSDKAHCFSSREPAGASYTVLDLTNPQLWNVIDVDLSPEQEAAARGYCAGADGKLYDGVGLLGYRFANPRIHDPHAVFCSEAGAAMCQVAGKDLGGKQPWQFSPGDLCALAKSGFGQAKAATV